MNKRFVVIKNKHLSAVLGRSSTLTPQQVVYLVSCQQSNVTSLGDPSSLTLLGGLSLTQEKRNRGKWHRKGETSSHFEAPLWFLCRAAPPWDKRPLCVAQAGGCRGVLWDWGGGSPRLLICTVHAASPPPPQPGLPAVCSTPLPKRPQRHTRIIWTPALAYLLDSRLKGTSWRHAWDIFIVVHRNHACFA